MRLAILTAALLSSPASFAQTAPVPGGLQRQLWTNLTGGKVSSLTSSLRFYQPASSTSIAGLPYEQLGSNYGARTRGYITPATAGLYTFWVAGDDDVQWFMAPSTTKWEAVKMSDTTSATPPNSWDEDFSQRSKTQYLKAGESYYVELLHKQSSGTGHAAVAWSMQGVNTGPLQNWATTAMGAVATQSATFNSSTLYIPSKAIDGNVSTFNLTVSAPGSWLQVDFRQDRLISSVELTNRLSTMQDRLSNFRLTVEDLAGEILASQDFYQLSGAVAASETWTLPKTVLGRRVKIQLLGPNRQNNYHLNLAEIKASGPDFSLKNWAQQPTAVATQSSTLSATFPASAAIDGNVSTITATTSQPSSSWQVDLGADRLIDTVELINRLDGYQDRLSNFRVSVLNAANAVVTSQDCFLTTGSVLATLRWELPLAVTGRKVKIQYLGSNRDKNYYLHLAEVNVWGRSNAADIRRGLREPIPASVMSTYVPSLTDDLDDDGIPQAIELANGLNPADPTDAIADFDQDGINNLAEIRAASNPNLLDSVSGILVDEIWHNILGDNLTASGYKSAITHDPDEIYNLTTSKASDRGNQYVRRVRGYLTAPVTGSYQFWGAADSDVDIFFSPTASKFDRELILDNQIFARNYNYDEDPSQKSRLVSLIAGQKYYFEIWHKDGIGGGYFSVAWTAPGGTRQLISSQYLASYAGDANDQDDDYLKDDYELANGLSITNDGRSLGSTDGAYGDLDGDGITNLSEMKAGTKANAADTDGDGVSDYDEANFYTSATLANDIGPFISVAALTGNSYSSSFGEWDKFNNTARQNCRRGSVTYAVTVPAGGIHAAKFTITSILDGAKSEQYEFDVKINGKRIAYKTINILPNGTSTLALLTPWLNPGETYNLELFVDNSYNFRRVSIDGLQILAAGGTDSNNNGTPDWVDIRLHDTNGFDTTNILSKISPATVEGNVKYIDFVNANGITINKAPNGRFFTEVPLTPGAPSTLNFTFENGAINETATVQWQPTNLLLENSLTLRQGDSLLLTAFQNAENASLENYTLTANGQTYTKTADQLTPVAFATPGTATLQLNHTGVDAVVTNRNITVTVLPLISAPAPLCVVGYPRLWTHPSLPAGATLQFDNQIIKWQEVAMNTYTLQTVTPENQQLLIRQGINGPILGYVELKSVSVRSSSKTGVQVIDNIPGYQILEMPVVAFGALDTAEIRCEIIIGGVSYLDGSTNMSLYSGSFDDFGTDTVIFKKPPAAHSNCHRFSIWHNGTRIALYN